MARPNRFYDLIFTGVNFRLFEWEECNGQVFFTTLDHFHTEYSLDVINNIIADLV